MNVLDASLVDAVAVQVAVSVSTATEPFSKDDGQSIVDFLNDSWQWLLIGVAVWIVLALISAIVLAKKAGYTGWWGAITVIAFPLAPLFMLFFAIVKWPALKERDEAAELLDKRGIPIPWRERALEKQAREVAKLEAEVQARAKRAEAERLRLEADRQAAVPTPAAGVPMVGGVGSVIPEGSPATPQSPPSSPQTPPSTGPISGAVPPPPPPPA